uniref:Uncharacterized protein n=1 Tax=Nelumbo nucifera TaxID=4432 RepID=A0A822Z649_NELNU|nr:TPA_asm: hypothetical protein HUJ06_013464 [Nelumbo nucifera]
MVVARCDPTFTLFDAVEDVIAKRKKLEGETRVEGGDGQSRGEQIEALKI